MRNINGRLMPHRDQETGEWWFRGEWYGSETEALDAYQEYQDGLDDEADRRGDEMRERKAWPELED